MQPNLSETPALPEALGQSEAFLEFQQRLSRVAPVERPVLILGERGTGKELAARRLHYLSKRWEGPFVQLNCAALAPGLIESELFGHEAGAFTGATRKRLGRFEAADSGTLFLDELGNIPKEVQEKILRTVEYGLFERVGGSEPVQVDVRIVGATNAHLPALVEAGAFMPDLLDRLSFEVLYVPPLRERPDDIWLLAEHFAARMAVELGLNVAPAMDDRVRETLLAHPWRGNVRELKNTVERAVYQAAGGTIGDIVFDPFAEAKHHDLVQPAQSIESRTPPDSDAMANDAAPVALPIAFTEAVAAYERDLVTAAMYRARHNQQQAAKLLGLRYHQFRGLYRKHKAEP